MMDSIFPILFGAVVAIVIGTFAVRVIKYGGFKAAMFGARIARTVGEVWAKGPRMFTLTVRVHSLDGGPSARQVGLEVVAKSFSSYQMLPITLSASDAAQLAGLIQEAATSAGSRAA